jgi:tetratricopeptide (TPR) repeat protein
VAAAIEAAYPDDSRYHQVLAGHYYVAGEALSEARYAILAAQEALKNGLFREAVFYLDRVLKLPIESEQKVIGMLSTAYFGLGDFQSSRAAAENGLRLLGVYIPRSDRALAIDLLREAVKQLLLRLLRGRWIFRRRHFDEAAIQKISTLLLHLGYIYEFECEKLFALCNTLKAINLVEIERIRSLRAVSYYFAAILYQARPLSALGMADRYVTLAEEALTRGQDHEHYGHALLVKAAYASMQGEWEAAMQTVTQARTFFSDRGAVRDVDNMLGLRVHCEFLMGEWDSCYSDATFVYESAQKRNDLQAALGSLMWMLSHWIRRGDREQMRVVMDQAPQYLQRSHSRSMVIWSGAMMGLAHYQLGNMDAARQAADPALKIVQRKSPISSWLHEPFSALAELYLNLWQDGDRGSRASAKIAYKALMNLGSVYRVSLPCAHIWQGRFHFLDGDLGRAAHCWQQALVMARQYRTPFYEGLAHHYLAHQPSDDPGEQQRHLETAKAIFERLSADGTWNPTP